MKFPRIAKLLKLLPSLVDIAAEINLAIFYLRGTYYDLSKRLLGIQLVRLFFLIRCMPPLIIIEAVLGFRRSTYTATVLFIVGSTTRHSPPPPFVSLYSSAARGTS